MAINERKALVLKPSVSTSSTEIWKRQKEADRKSRQLYANGVAVLRLYGEHERTPFGWGDSWSVARQGQYEGFSTDVGLIGRREIRPDIAAIYFSLDGEDTNFFVNNTFGKVAGEGYKRRADIFEVEKFEEIAYSIRDFPRTEQIPDPKYVTELERLSAPDLLGKLHRLEGWRQFYGKVGAVVVGPGAVSIFGAAMIGAPIEVTGGIGGVTLFAGGGALIAQNAVEDKIVGIWDELSSRDIHVDRLFPH